MNVNIVRIACLSALLVGSAASSAAQPARDLSMLTVPEDRLPPGCRLKPEEPRPASGSPAVRRLETWPSGPTNPWSGPDRRLAAAIRQRIDGVPQEPDAAPLDRRAARAYELKWADNVVEAYRATYRPADHSLIEVFAVRFNDQTLAAPEPANRSRNLSRGVNSRVVLGPSVVLISSATDSTCFAAIGTYVRSLR